MARAADSSQFEWKDPSRIGWRSVWPSTRRTQSIPGGIRAVTSCSVRASARSCGLRRRGRAGPSPTRTGARTGTRTGRPRRAGRAGPRALSCRPPKNSERYCSSSSTRLGECLLELLVEPVDLVALLVDRGFGCCELLVQVGDFLGEQFHLALQRSRGAFRRGDLDGRSMGGFLGSDRVAPPPVPPAAVRSRSTVRSRSCSTEGR